ncbi:hypothetical protein FVO59_08540 [Microbacterium esteraromaticum]|uniref:PH domain-containing protein n=1 Tax=Microbacterium esteraromaticum TaxID=57043 RepID=A0A7D7WDE3_9MICO|nr:hypothetical protein [Microbacterium esteraromaticum]QMU97257.1 hypothetical protein FVO59_08540 [Microbacterium esteraromaticum]
MTQTAAAATAEPRRIAPQLHGAERLRHGIRRATAMEAAGWRSIGRALLGRPRVPHGATGFSYDRPVRTILIIFLVLSAIEIPVIDLLVHGIAWLRWPLLALGVWGVLTMLGMLLSHLTRPHSVGPDGIRVRHGGEVDIDLPWEMIASVQRRRHSLSGAPQLSLTGAGDEQVLNQVIQDHSEIEIALERPTLLPLPQGDVTVAAVRISVDDPAAFLDAVRTHIP